MEINRVVSSMKDYLTGKKDLAMILSECECTAAATYTMNRVKAAPLYVTMEHLEDGVIRGVIANSGNANACAPMGHENAQKMCEAAAAATGLNPSDFAVASTGVIGVELNVAAIEAGMPALAEQLSADGSDAARGHHDHRYGEEGDSGLSYHWREDRDHRRHCQGLRNDSPQYGNHAGIFNNRLRDQCRNAPKCIENRCGGYL